MKNMNIFKHGQEDSGTTLISEETKAFADWKSKVNRWHVTGYAGWHDYDGPQDDNVNYILYLDKSVTKDEVYALLDERYKNKRSTAFSVERLVEERKETMGNIEEKKQTAEDIELTGKVILDEEAYAKLRKKIRAEVIADIKSNGNYGNEIEEYLEACDCEIYVRMIRNTIGAIMVKEADEKSAPFFKERDWTVLKAIYSVLLIGR